MRDAETDLLRELKTSRPGEPGTGFTPSPGVRLANDVLPAWRGQTSSFPSALPVRIVVIRLASAVLTHVGSECVLAVFASVSDSRTSAYRRQQIKVCTLRQPVLRIEKL
jgi:hypothetical protein